jgi:hypothetical protein
MTRRVVVAAGLGLLLGCSGKAGRLTAPRRLAAGRIVYAIDFVPNPAYKAVREDVFSDELHRKVMRHNVPERREVHFDGRRARIEEVNCDYGFKSPAMKLLDAVSHTVVDCKQLRHVAFCVEYPMERPAPRDRPASLTLLDETEVIAGLRARRGNWQGDRGPLAVWFTDELQLEDPTGAVRHLEGVPGLLLKEQPREAASTIDLLERVTVVELSREAPSPDLFSPPAGYRRFASLDAARAEDRRLLEAAAAEELGHRPLTEDEKRMFMGRWGLESPANELHVEIAPGPDGALRFTTTYSRAPRRPTEERAAMKGRLLLVEEPPNYRLYRMADGGRTMVEVDNEVFTFRRP